MPLALEINGLTITAGAEPVVRGIHLQLHAGAAFTVLGESGSGKTVSALSLLRLVQNAQVQGSAQFQGRDLLQLSERELRAVMLLTGSRTPADLGLAERRIGAELREWTE